MYSVESAGELLCAAGFRLPPDSVLLPVFPDNHPVDCLRSLTFLSEWLRLRHSLLVIRAPCILWGHSPLVRSMPETAGFAVIPWRVSPGRLRSLIADGVAPLPDTGGPPVCRCPCCTASGPSSEGAQDAASFWPLTRKNNDKTITP
ncbi:hypothetical protein AA220_004955 [Salmonella enterica subsp. enterica serovar Pomona]|nr:hypothetical protein [Salmonella enterica subsp. enterica serovar Pomona]